MTDYAAMTDREIDAMVAEKVFGWKMDKRTGYVRSADPESTVPACKAYPYSTDLNHAVRAAEAMRAKGFYFLINCKPGEEWNVICAEHGPKVGKVKHKSLARALSIACLLAHDAGQKEVKGE